MAGSTSVQDVESGTIAGTPEQASVLNALNNKNFVWRTISGLVKETKLSEGDVLVALNSLPEGTLATATGKQGRLFTTRDHYYKTQSFLGRFLTAATGRFK